MQQCVRACMHECVCVCVCVCLCVYMKKDLKNTMQREILKERKLSYLKTLTLLEDTISVFQYVVWISTPAASEKIYLLNNISRQILKAIRKREFNRIMIAHLKKVNSMKGKVGVFVISEKNIRRLLSLWVVQISKFFNSLQERS